MNQKLNGWMRLKIVISIIFLICSSMYGLKNRADERYKYFEPIYDNCVNSISSIVEKETYHSEHEKCWKDSLAKADDFNGGEIRSYFEYISVYSLIPLSLIWFFGYIFFKIYLWVKKGFE